MTQLRTCFRRIRGLENFEPCFSRCHSLRTLVDQTDSRTKQIQPPVFNKNVRLKHLDRSSMADDAHLYDYLRDYAAKDICDRLKDLKMVGLQTILNIGSCSGLVSKNINQNIVGAFIQADISKSSLKRSQRSDSMLPPQFPIDYLVCDEEAIAVREKSVDIVMSCLDLHWVNDLLTCFRQVKNTLCDNKPFIGMIFGGDTLFELKNSLQMAEMERLSGFSAHIAPKTTGQDIARLLHMAGFQLITVDVSDVKIYYPSMFELMFDLQGMGENNSSLIGSSHMHRNVLKAAAAIYQYTHGEEDFEKGVPATFQMIHFIGWKNPIKATPLNNK